MKPPRRALRAHGLVSRSLLLGLPVQRRPRPQDPRMGLRPTHGPSWTPGALQSTAWPRRHTTLRPRRAVFTSTSKGPPRPHPPCAPLCRRTASRCAVLRGSFTICPCRASRPSARTSTLLWCPWASCSGQASAAVFTLPAASSSPLRESSLTWSWTTVCGTCPSLTATLAPSAAPRPSRSRLSSLQAAAAHPGLRYPRRHRLAYPCRPSRRLQSRLHAVPPDTRPCLRSQLLHARRRPWTGAPPLPLVTRSPSRGSPRLRRRPSTGVLLVTRSSLRGSPRLRRRPSTGVLLVTRSSLRGSPRPRRRP